MNEGGSVLRLSDKLPALVPTSLVSVSAVSEVAVERGELRAITFVISVYCGGVMGERTGVKLVIAFEEAADLVVLDDVVWREFVVVVVEGHLLCLGEVNVTVGGVVIMDCWVLAATSSPRGVVTRAP